jgi:membrane protease YdiL (CAAX protease family)
MAFVDHLMIFLLFVVQPIHGAYAYKRYVAKIDAAAPAEILKQYRTTMLAEWSALAALTITWLALGRPLAPLGLNTPAGTGFQIGLLLLLAMTIYQVYAWRQAAAAKPEERAKFVESCGSLRHFMPHNRQTYSAFFWLSITAGIVEEILYRGFVFWYLGQFMPVWAVVVVSAVAFGLGHSYQGLAGMVRVTVIGIVFGGYYLLTGSIWLPIVTHAVLDILQGATLLEYLRDRGGITFLEQELPPDTRAPSIWFDKQRIYRKRDPGERL